MFKRVMRSINARRRTAWLIAGILILPFILFFHGSFGPQGGPGGAAGRVFGRDVSWEDFQLQRFWIRRQFVNRLGPEVPESLEPLITQYTWERLMLLAEADRQGLRIGDREVAALLQSLPAFDDQGRFASERYYQFVSALGLTPRRFEELIRQDLIVEQLLDAVRAEVTISDDEVRDAYLEAQERLRVALVHQPFDAFEDAVREALTDADLQAAYEDTPDRWRVPAQMTFRYLGRTVEDVRDADAVTDEAIADEYAAHAAEFVAEDGTPVPLEEVRDALRTRLAERQATQALVALTMVLEDELAAGASFEELARTHDLTAKTIGPVAVQAGWTPGLPEPEVLNAMAGRQRGSAPHLIETASGVYVAELLDRAASYLPPLEEVRNAVADHLIAAGTRAAAQRALQTLRDELSQALDTGTEFAEACRGADVKPTHPKPFTRDEPVEPLGPVPLLTQAAFATPTGTLSPVVETPTGWAMVFVEERLAADPEEFTEAERSVWSERVRAEKEQQRLADWLNDVRARAKLESFLDEVARAS